MRFKGRGRAWRDAERGWFALALVASLLATPAGAGVTYDEVTDEAGISFRLAGEVSQGLPVDPWPGFPEVLGSGACWADFDRDGYDDLYLVNQRFNPENPNTDGWRDSLDPRNKLYRNNGDGTFTDRSAEAGVDHDGFGYGCSVADYDGDGWLDLYVTNYLDMRFRDNALYRNHGDGTFTDMAEEAGVAMMGACGEDPCTNVGSAWADYDNDGDLDLYAYNYVETFLADTLRSPTFHNGQVNWLFRNDGDGTFAEVAEHAGVQGSPTDADGSKSLGAVWFDADLDGDMDLYVTNDGVPNDYYENQGDGTFAERSDASGLADSRAGMGVTAGDYDSDGLPDLFFTHYVAEDNGFYRNNGDGTFEDRSGEDDLQTAQDKVGWATHFVDQDRDMDADILVVNGHTGDSDGWYEMPRLVYRQDANSDVLADPWDKVWVDVTNQSGPGMTMHTVGRGGAWADYDHDGDTDLMVVNNKNDTANLLRATRDDGHQWLTVKLQQPGMNRDAIGARVALEAGGVTQWREVQAGSSYLSQNTLNLEFGLGSHARADRITVHWPAGGTTQVEGVPAGHVVRIERATGQVVPDTLAPVTELVVSGQAGRQGWWSSPVEVAFDAQDRGVGTMSGVATTEYRLDDGAWTAWNGLPVPVLQEGMHTFTFRSEDADGNVEPAKRAEVGVDLTLPEVSHEVVGEQGDHGWYLGEEVAVVLAASDALSGLAEVRFRLNDGPWTTYDDDGINITEEGVHVVTYTAEDNAGNEAPPVTLTVRLDRSAPDLELVKPKEGTIYMDDDDVAYTGIGPAVIVATPGVGPLVGQRFVVQADAGDDVSGMSRVVFLVNNFVVRVDFEAPYQWVWDTRWWPPGSYELDALAIDKAGNTAATSASTMLVSTPGVPGVRP